VYNEHANDMVRRGIFQFVQSTGAPFCTAHGAICGCLSCAETETICIQFCPRKCFGLCVLQLLVKIYSGVLLYLV